MLDTWLEICNPVRRKTLISFNSGDNYPLNLRVMSPPIQFPFSITNASYELKNDSGIGGAGNLKIDCQLIYGIINSAKGRYILKVDYTLKYLEGTEYKTIVRSQNFDVVVT